MSGLLDALELGQSPAVEFFAGVLTLPGTADGIRRPGRTLFPLLGGGSGPARQLGLMVAGCESRRRARLRGDTSGASASDG